MTAIESLSGALSEEGAEAFGLWLRVALRSTVVDQLEPPRPLLLSGDGADEIAHYLAVSLARAGVDALPVPRSWVSPAGKGPPESVPGLLLLTIDGAWADERIEALAARSALLIAGSDTVPAIAGACLLHLDLAPDRVANLRTLQAADWPDQSKE